MKGDYTMIRKVLIFVFIFIGVNAGPAFAVCPIPHLTIVSKQNPYSTGDQITLTVNHEKGVTIEFKFESRAIKTNKLFDPDFPYNPDNNTKVTNISTGAGTITQGQVVETMSGQWRGYARARCLVGQPDKKKPQQTITSGWSAPVEFTVLDKGSNGLFGSVRTDPASYTGVCPKTITAYGRIQSYMGGTTVNYSWLLSDGQTSPGGVLTFSTPGIQDTNPMGFVVGGKTFGQYKDPPHSGLISLIINGQKAWPPSASYQVNCTVGLDKIQPVRKKLP